MKEIPLFSAFDMQYALIFSIKMADVLVLYVI